MHAKGMPKIQIDLELCDGCGACVVLCPALVLELRNGKVEVGNPEACLGVRGKQLCSDCRETMETCLGCVVCVKGCPKAAIEIFET